VFEGFYSSTLIPGLQISSEGGGFGIPPGPGYGHIDTGLPGWVDCTGKSCDLAGYGNVPYTFTTVSYDHPIWGFSGTWTIASGYGIELHGFEILQTLDPFELGIPPSQIPPNAAAQGFVGFILDQPINNFSISWWSPYSGVGTLAVYDLQFLELLTSNPIPEPASWALASLACVSFLCTLLLLRRRARLSRTKAAVAGLESADNRQPA
jgi:hypothetical protein